MALRGPEDASPEAIRDLAATNLVMAKQVRQMARVLRIYALEERDSHKSIAFFGNDARTVLASYLKVDVKELEPGTPRAFELLNELR